nr:hypothetical protein [Paenarthrobacter aurescens]
MTTGTRILAVVREDIGDTSWWARILTILGSQSGSTQQRFVGRTGGKTKYKSPTFSVPGSVGPISPEERWAPGDVVAQRPGPRTFGPVRAPVKTPS